MPYCTYWVDPQEFLTHKGITVYRLANRRRRLYRLRPC